MYLVLGHVHTGTTCAAKVLQVAGVDFGAHCNERIEDRRVLRWYAQMIEYTDMHIRSWANDSARALMATYPEQALKHPLTAICIDDWLAARDDIQCLATVRSPQSWITTMDGKEGWDCWEVYDFQRRPLSGWAENAAREWLYCYEPILDLAKRGLCELVRFGTGAEQAFERALSNLGLVYRGGFDSARVHIEDRDDYCPVVARDTWEQLRALA